MVKARHWETCAHHKQPPTHSLNSSTPRHARLPVLHPHTLFSSNSAMSSQPPDPNDPTPAPQEPTIRFRPGKKRKVYRQRDESSPPPQTTTSVTSPPPNRDVDKGVDQEDDDASSAALKLRNARKHRAGGVGFGSRESDAARPSNSTTALVPSSQDGSDAVAYGMNRFTHQTGLVSSLHDKHMYVPPSLVARPALGLSVQSQLIIQDGIHRIPPLPPLRTKPR
jgi:hypothetical protein